MILKITIDIRNIYILLSIYRKFNKYLLRIS